MKVRVHAVNKKTRGGLSTTHEKPHALSWVYNLPEDQVHVDRVVAHYKSLGDEQTEMLVEVVPMDGKPSWEE